MSLIPFPNVPDVPGVPDLPRLPNVGLVAQSALGIVQGAIWDAILTDAVWGIYDSAGKPLADPSNVNQALNSAGFGSTLSTNSVDYSNASKLSDFPVERGSFAQYNKVDTPGDAKVTFAFTGTVAERNKFLQAIHDASKSTNLYDVVTPEFTYIQYAIVDYSYSRRAEKGANLLMVDLTLTEIRQVSSQYSNASGAVVAPTNSDAAPRLNAGKIQPATPAQSVLHAVTSKFTSLVSP